MSAVHSSATPMDRGRVEYRFECHDLPDTFRVMAFGATEALNTPFQLEVHLWADDEATDTTQLLGREISFGIAPGRGFERVFHGIVDSLTVHDDGETRQTSTVVVVPALLALRRTVNTRIFQGMTALAIVEQVLGEGLGPYQREFRSDSVDAARLVPRDYCVQYRESNLDFVHRLLEDEGIGYHFVHEGPRETLLLFDDTRRLGPATTLDGGPVRGDSPNRTASSAEQLLSFSIHANRTATALAIRDRDWTTTSTVEQTSILSGPDTSREHEVYEHGLGRHLVISEDADIRESMLQTAFSAAALAGVPLPLADRFRDHRGAVLSRFTRSNVEDRARIRRQWHERDAHICRATTTISGMAVGHTFDLVGHATLGADGRYFVTKVTHSDRAAVDALEPGAPSAEGSRWNYENQIECLPLDTPWRPDLATPKPRIEGVQTATVTGPEGMGVHTDAYGRVKVHFDWDRSQRRLDGDQSCWVRVSQVWAGQGAAAFLFVPRIGMEVVVSFVDGDPDRPLVTGCVYNGDNVVPGLLPEQATKSIIRTRSLPFGDGYNELSFEDAAGHERVYLRAERDLSELVQNDHDIRVGQNARVQVGGTQIEEFGCDQRVSVGRHRRCTTGGDNVEVVMGHQTRSVGGSAHDEVGRDYRLEVDGAMSTRVGAGEWVTEAKQDLTLRQGEGENSLRMTSEEEGRGIRIESHGSLFHITEERIELRVGESVLVVTPGGIQANGRTLPVVPSPGNSATGEDVSGASATQTEGGTQ